MNGWKINPLNWEAKIDIKLVENNRMQIKHRVVSNGYLTSMVFTDLFENFLINVKEFINQDKDFIMNNLRQIKLAKRKVLKCSGLIIMGVLSGSFFGFVLTHFTGNQIFYIVGIIIGGLMIQKIINQNLIKNTARLDSV